MAEEEHANQEPEVLGVIREISITETTVYAPTSSSEIAPASEVSVNSEQITAQPIADRPVVTHHTTHRHHRRAGRNHHHSGRCAWYWIYPCAEFYRQCHHRAYSNYRRRRDRWPIGRHDFRAGVWPRQLLTRHGSLLQRPAGLYPAPHLHRPDRLGLLRGILCVSIAASRLPWLVSSAQQPTPSWFLVCW